jgi:uncharacterized protein (TIGR03437 family)
VGQTSSRFYATGLGEDATDNDGNVSPTVEALIDAQPAVVLYAGRAPGYTGLNQLNIALPSLITQGTHSLVIKRNGVASRSVTIQTK